MSVNERRSILRRNPYADRRSFVARAMGLTPIGDIASGGMTESDVAETITWETATDWDNAVVAGSGAEEPGVVHENVSNTDHSDDTKLIHGYSYTNPLNTGLVSHVPLHEDSGSPNDIARSATGTNNGASQGQTGILNSTSYDFVASNSDYLDFGNPSALQFSDFPISIFAAFKSDGDTGSSQGIYTKILSGDEREWGLDLDSDGTMSNYNGDQSGSNSNTSTFDGNWHIGGFTVDSSGNLNWYLDGSTDGSASLTNGYTGNNAAVWVGMREAGGWEFDGLIGEIRLYDRELSSSEATLLTSLPTSEQSLTTDTKSFGSTSQPNLTSLSYTLNGQTIILDVIGSPGTASEEVVSQTLDGSTSYSLTWSNSHTDFRLKPRFNSSDPTAAATFNAGSLSA